MHRMLVLAAVMDCELLRSAWALIVFLHAVTVCLALMHSSKGRSTGTVPKCGFQTAVNTRKAETVSENDLVCEVLMVQGTWVQEPFASQQHCSLSSAQALSIMGERCGRSPGTLVCCTYKDTDACQIWEESPEDQLCLAFGH